MDATAFGRNHWHGNIPTGKKGAIMDISARIRELRNEQGISQEQLAIKVGVSRQAVTKWETGAGAPDIENLATLARVFGVTVDEILNGGAATTATSAYESVTSLDLEQEKNYDIEVGCARAVRLRTVEGEKLTVRLSSTAIEDLASVAKVLVDTQGRNLDISVKSCGVVADALLRRELDVLIDVPSSYAASAEISLNAHLCSIEGVLMDVEVSGQADCVLLRDVEGHVELDLTGNVEIWASGTTGKLDVNQMGAVSILHIPASAAFATRTKGHLGRRTLRFSRDGEPCEQPATDTDAPLAIELAGARVELTVDLTEGGHPSYEQLRDAE